MFIIGCVVNIFICIYIWGIDEYGVFNYDWSNNIEFDWENKFCVERGFVLERVFDGVLRI